MIRFCTGQRIKIIFLMTTKTIKYHKREQYFSIAVEHTPLTLNLSICAHVYMYRKI